MHVHQVGVTLVRSNRDVAAVSLAHPTGNSFEEQLRRTLTVTLVLNQPERRLWPS